MERCGGQPGKPPVSVTQLLAMLFLRGSYWPASHCGPPPRPRRLAGARVTKGTHARAHTGTSAPRRSPGGGYTATVTRRKVAGMEVASSLGLAFWLLKRVSNSACSSASRPSAAAASNAFMVGP